MYVHVLVHICMMYIYMYVSLSNPYTHIRKILNIFSEAKHLCEFYQHYKKVNSDYKDSMEKRKFTSRQIDCDALL